MNFPHYLTLFAILVSYCDTEKIPIKIVDDPVNYEHANNAESSVDLGAAAAEDSDWLTTVHPANFSGPEQLRQLIGQCFAWSNFKYKYEFCPFHNLTQHEISSTWNPYKGVLGVWGEWRIRDNMFSNMLLMHGDACEGGMGNRSVEVSLQCAEGVFGQISEVTEPDRCRYHVIFSSQLVCHPHALLVYPWLSKEHQHRWDQLYSEHHRAEITDKGLEVGLHRLFRAAGLYLTDETRAGLRSASRQRRPAAPGPLPSTPCELQLQHLRAELDHLRGELTRLTRNKTES